MEILILLFSTILSILSIWVLKAFSINLGVRNTINENRWQIRKPSLGGTVFIFVFYILFIFLILYILKEPEKDLKIQLGGIVLSSSIAYIAGLVDDAKNTNPLLKLIAQIVCGLILVFSGTIIELSPNSFWNGMLTVLWVVFLMNSINMLDNMDGLTSLISIYILVAMLLIDIDIQNLLVLKLLSIGVIGALIGFLFYNWKPSSIYMGDSGSQFLGIFLAIISILFIWEFREPNQGYFQVKQIMFPFLIFTVPIFDTSTVFIHRILRGQSPFVGGRDHLSHFLFYLGLNEHLAVIFLGFLNLVFSFVALYMYFYPIAFQNIFIYTFILWVTSFIFIQFLYIFTMRKVLYKNQK